jgi:NADPH:quinone reductase-like Zn-dependent oxidoreductase
MKAIVQDRYGSADVLEFKDIEEPVVGDEDVLIRVHAAGCGPDVWHLMTGMPYMARLAIGLRTPKLPVLGWDVAGTLERHRHPVRRRGHGYHERLVRGTRDRQG